MEWGQEVLKEKETEDVAVDAHTAAQHGHPAELVL